MQRVAQHTEFLSYIDLLYANTSIFSLISPQYHFFSYYTRTHLLYPQYIKSSIYVRYNIFFSLIHTRYNIPLISTVSSLLYVQLSVFSLHTIVSLIYSTSHTPSLISGVLSYICIIFYLSIYLSSYMSFPAISVYLLWIYIAIPK